MERQRSVLSQELDANVKAQKQLSLDWESLRLQQEEQLRKEQEVAGELKQKSRMYEAWIQKLIHQDEFLLNLSDNMDNAITTIKAAKGYKINHLQLSHQIIHNLMEVKNESVRNQVRNLTRLAHQEGIGEVLVWDHSF